MRKKLFICLAGIDGSGKSTIAEEAPYAYKDVNEVTEAVTGAGLARPVVRMKPLGVIKG